ncbi:MAG: ribosome maturation factor RimM [Desulfobacterales bacterium]|nr:ribosome maturation factor RimM [Desulfobacterales bacterium]
MQTDAFLLIGKIVGTHSLKGVIKVYSYAHSGSVFKPGIPIFLKDRNGQIQTYSLAWAKPHKRIMRMALQGIDHVARAEELIGADIFIENTRLPELQAGTYYWNDIIGLSVYTVDNKYLGRIESVIPTGSNDVYVVKDATKGKSFEILIPALASVVVKVDLESKTMQVDLPEGL